MLTPITTMVMTSTSIFVLTLLVSVWAAYDLASALIRLAMIGVGLALMVGIAWAGRSHAKTVLSLAGVGCAFGAAAISIAYVLRLNQNSGAVASGLMVLLPLAASGVWWHWLRQQWFFVWSAGGALAISAAIFLITFERTAWIGLGIGLIGTGYIYWRFGTSTSSPTRLQHVSDWVIGLVMVSGFTLYSVLFFTPMLDGFIGHTAIGDALLGRLELWRESLALGRDYYFTGSGLGMTAMVYSTYVLSMRVPYWYHAHNLYLQIALEQGVLGLLAFLGMALPLLGTLVITYRNSGPYSRWFCLATLTTLIAVLSYGLLDAEIYATTMVTTLFIPLGFALALHWALLNRQQNLSNSQTLRPSSLVLGGSGVVPVVALIVLCIWPGAFEKFYINFGVLTQTKAELSRYRWPIWPIQDELRRREAVDLSAAIAYYQAALALDPRNATAHQRLGQIALSRGDYPAALKHLHQAYMVEPNRGALHRLLGEVYAVTGDPARAAMLWQTVDMEYGQIEDRLLWYGYLNAKQEVDWIQQALARIPL